MVGATPSPAELAETKSDAELTAEIAPAMLVKLREDGTARGYAMGGILFALLMVWFLADRTESSSYFYWGLGVTVILQVSLPLFFKRRSVTNEVRYRRQHGKWRWER